MSKGGTIRNRSENYQIFREKQKFNPPGLFQGATVAYQNPSVTYMPLMAHASDYAVRETKKGTLYRYPEIRFRVPAILKK